MQSANGSLSFLSVRSARLCASVYCACSTAHCLHSCVVVLPVSCCTQFACGEWSLRERRPVSGQRGRWSARLPLSTRLGLPPPDPSRRASATAAHRSDNGAGRWTAAPRGRQWATEGSDRLRATGVTHPLTTRHASSETHSSDVQPSDWGEASDDCNPVASLQSARRAAWFSRSPSACHLLCWSWNRRLTHSQSAIRRAAPDLAERQQPQAMSRSRESSWLTATCQLRSDTATHVDALIDCLALQQHYGHIRRVRTFTHTSAMMRRANETDMLCSSADSCNSLHFVRFVCVCSCAIVCCPWRCGAEPREARGASGAHSQPRPKVTV